MTLPILARGAETWAAVEAQSDCYATPALCPRCAKSILDPFPPMANATVGTTLFPCAGLLRFVFRPKTLTMRENELWFPLKMPHRCPNLLLRGVLKGRDFFFLFVKDSPLRTAPRGLFAPAQRGPCLSPLFGDRQESRSYVATPPSFGRHL